MDSAPQLQRPRSASNYNSPTKSFIIYEESGNEIREKIRESQFLGAPFGVPSSIDHDDLFVLGPNQDPERKRSPSPSPLKGRKVEQTTQKRPSSAPAGNRREQNKNISPSPSEKKVTSKGKFSLDAGDEDDDSAQSKTGNPGNDSPIKRKWYVPNSEVIDQDDPLERGRRSTSKGNQGKDTLPVNTKGKDNKSEGIDRDDPLRRAGSKNEKSGKDLVAQAKGYKEGKQEQVMSDEALARRSQWRKNPPKAHTAGGTAPDLVRFDFLNSSSVDIGRDLPIYRDDWRIKAPKALTFSGFGAESVQRIDEKRNDDSFLHHDKPIHRINWMISAPKPHLLVVSQQSVDTLPGKGGKIDNDDDRLRRDLPLPTLSRPKIRNNNGNGCGHVVGFGVFCEVCLLIEKKRRHLRKLEEHFESITNAHFQSRKGYNKFDVTVDLHLHGIEKSGKIFEESIANFAELIRNEEFACKYKES
jgi:hypothetical protein